MDRTIQNSGQLKKGIALLLPFIKEPWKDFTLTEIKSITKNRSHHYVYNSLEKFSVTSRNIPNSKRKRIQRNF